MLPANTVVRAGKYLEGEETGVLASKVGPLLFVGRGGEAVCAGPLISTCSQQYFNGSPSPSVADAVKTKGVEMGTE
ncbi:MAG: hypothetical protein IPK46_04620 [Saprospiraceae bacterium]|nr:hypothetical protein [Saprospiraceae bacterium]